MLTKILGGIIAVLVMSLIVCGLAFQAVLKSEGQKLSAQIAANGRLQNANGVQSAQLDQMQGVNAAQADAISELQAQNQVANEAASTLNIEIQGNHTSVDTARQAVAAQTAVSGQGWESCQPVFLAARVQLLKLQGQAP